MTPLCGPRSSPASVASPPKGDSNWSAIPPSRSSKPTHISATQRHHHRLPFADPTIEALAASRADLNVDHVEPVACLSAWWNSRR